MVKTLKDVRDAVDRMFEKTTDVLMESVVNHVSGPAYTIPGFTNRAFLSSDVKKPVAIRYGRDQSFGEARTSSNGRMSWMYADEPDKLKTGFLIPGIDLKYGSASDFIMTPAQLARKKVYVPKTCDRYVLYSLIELEIESLHYVLKIFADGRVKIGCKTLTFSEIKNEQRRKKWFKSRYGHMNFGRLNSTSSWKRDNRREYEAMTAAVPHIARIIKSLKKTGVTSV